jgi:hypothetical protein
MVGLGLVGVGAGSTAARLLNGEAWLANARTGTISLANGYSGKASAGVRTGLRPGDPFTVVQRPDGAYVVDERNGDLVRIDGTRLEGSSPGPTTGLGVPDLEVVANGRRTYVVDRTAGLVQPVDPTTLRPDGPRVDLNDAISEAVVDGHGNLWAALPGAGAVVEVDGSKVVGRHLVGQDDDAISVGVTSTCVEAVDATSGVATCLTGSGATVRIPGGADRVPVVAASPSSPDLLSVEGVQATAIDIRADTTHTSSLPAGAHVTQAVVNGDNAYLLNQSSQQVVDVDLSNGAPGNPFSPPGGATDLTEGGGLVFANNANGPQAIAIAPDGAQTPIQKYDPENPYAAVGPAPRGPAAAPVPGGTQAVPADGQPSQGGQGVQGDTTSGAASGLGAVPTVPATSPVLLVPSTTTSDPSGKPSSTPPPPSGVSPRQSSPQPQTPGQPTNVNATGGNQTVTATWQAPVGATLVSAYNVYDSAGRQQLGVSSTTATFKGLPNGTQDCVKVQAVSTGGQTGPFSAASCATPASTTPVPPTAVHASLTGTTATVTWAPPAPSPAFPTPAKYLVTPSHGGAQTVTATSATFPNLADGTAYTFSVSSLTASGAASAAIASNSVTPMGPPTVPTGLTLTPSTTSITVSFRPPTGDGGSPVVHYKISISSAGGGGGTYQVASAGSYPEPAPTQDTLYTVSVSATNGAGLTGPAASGQATTAFATTTLYLCYLPPSTNPAAPPEDYMMSTASNCTEPPYAAYTYEGVSFPVADSPLTGTTQLYRCYTTAGHHMELTDKAACGPDAAPQGDQPDPFGFVWLSPGAGHNQHINELFNSGMEVCVPDADVSAWEARGFTSNRGGFYVAG